MKGQLLFIWKSEVEEDVKQSEMQYLGTACVLHVCIYFTSNTQLADRSHGCTILTIPQLLGFVSIAHHDMRSNHSVRASIQPAVREV